MPQSIPRGHPYSPLELRLMETERKSKEITMSSATRAKGRLEALRSSNLSAAKPSAALPALGRLADIRRKGSV